MQSEEKVMNRFDKDIKVSLCTPEFKSFEIQTTFFLVLLVVTIKRAQLLGKTCRDD